MRKRALGSLLIGGVLAAVMSLAVILPANAAAVGQAVRIKNFGNGLCLQPAGDSGVLGTAIVQEPCSTDPTQVWLANPGGVYFINSATGLCLDARGGAANNVPVEEWTCGNITNVKWSASYGTSSAIPIASKVAGSNNFCLDVPNQSLDAGTALQIFKCNGTVAQLWYVQ